MGHGSTMRPCACLSLSEGTGVPYTRLFYPLAIGDASVPAGGARGFALRPGGSMRERPQNGAPTEGELGGGDAAGGRTGFDGERGGPPHVELCNDPRGTLLQANAELTDAGWLRVVQSRVPVFDLERSLQENARAELRITYDDDYWALHDVLGTSEEYALHVD